MSSSPPLFFPFLFFSFLYVRVRKFCGGAEVRSPQRSTYDARPLLLALARVAWNVMQILYESVTARTVQYLYESKPLIGLVKIVEWQVAIFGIKATVFIGKKFFGSYCKFYKKIDNTAKRLRYLECKDWYGCRRLTVWPKTASNRMRSGRKEKKNKENSQKKKKKKKKSGGITAEDISMRAHCQRR